MQGYEENLLQRRKKFTMANSVRSKSNLGEFGPKGALEWCARGLGQKKTLGVVVLCQGIS